MRRAASPTLLLAAVVGPLGPVLAQDMAADMADAVLVPEVAVTGRGERGTGPVEGYQATRSVSATRTDTPLREIPQSISVVPQAVLEDIPAVRLDAALDYAGGVARGNNFGGQTLFEVNIRGFATGEYYRNGFPLNRGYQGSPDTAGGDGPRHRACPGPGNGRPPRHPRSGAGR